MQIAPIAAQLHNALPELAGTQLTASQAANTTQPATPFSSVFRSMIEQTTALETRASDAVSGVLNGTGVELHDAMIATQKADLGFEFALQVRNKALAGFQQLMNTQF